MQLPLELDGIPVAPADRWAALPERCQHEALRVLARVIARGVLDDGIDENGDDSDW